MQPTLVTTDMRYWRVAPDPRLAGVVVCYWMVESTPEGLRKRSDESQSLMIPDGHAEIVLNRSSAAFARWKLDAPHRCAEMRRSYLIGGRSHSVSTRSLQPLSLAGVKLDPRFLRRITGVPLDEFRDDTLELRESGDASLLDLEDQVAGGRDAASVVACFDRYFLARMDTASPPANAADALARHIHATRGVVSILEWARQTGVDSRHLERGFARDFGMTPKKYARVVRFKHLYRRLLGAPRGMSLASQIGEFYDQSHFNREFRYFTGTAPGILREGRGNEDFSVSDHLLRSEH